jgi:hypothetical protein
MGDTGPAAPARKSSMTMVPTSGAALRVRPRKMATVSSRSGTRFHAVRAAGRRHAPDPAQAQH